MLFREIVGQKETKAGLLQSFNSSRIAHALLFSGPEGSGSLALAIAYAQYLLCQNKGTDDACGTCSSCLMAQKLGHPDLHLAFPITLNKESQNADDQVIGFRELFLADPYVSYSGWMSSLDGENKQGIIGVKESENILKKLSLTSYAGGFKIMIVWLPEKMNAQAANKLLKIIEEPPDKTVFLLVTENEDRLLPTIVSRTQLVRIRRLTDDEIFESLIRNKQLSESAAKSISWMAEGNYRLALDLAGKDGNAEESDFDRFRNWMRLCYKGDIIPIQSWVNSSAELSREALKGFILHSLQMVRESLLLNYGDAALVRLSGEELEFLKKFSVYIHKGNCRRMIQDLEDAGSAIDWNANIRILLTDLSLRLRNHLRVPNAEVKAQLA